MHSPNYEKCLRCGAFWDAHREGGHPFVVESGICVVCDEAFGGAPCGCGEMWPEDENDTEEKRDRVAILRRNWHSGAAQ